MIQITDREGCTLVDTCLNAAYARSPDQGAQRRRQPLALRRRPKAFTGDRLGFLSHDNHQSRP